MKKFAKLFAVVLAAVTVCTVFVGCSARTPATADSFKKVAQSQGFKVGAGSPSASGATPSVAATKDESDTEIDFYLFPDGNTAQQQYETLKQSAAPNGGGTSTDSSAYNRYVLTNGELYYNIIRMDDTLIYCQATVTNKDEVDNFIKAIKY